MQTCSFVPLPTFIILCQRPWTFPPPKCTCSLSRAPSQGRPPGSCPSGALTPLLFLGQGLEAPFAEPCPHSCAPP